MGSTCHNRTILQYDIVPRGKVEHRENLGVLGVAGKVLATRGDLSFHDYDVWAVLVLNHLLEGAWEIVEVGVTVADEGDANDGAVLDGDIAQRTDRIIDQTLTALHAVLVLCQEQLARPAGRDVCVAASRLDLDGGLACVATEIRAALVVVWTVQVRGTIFNASSRNDRYGTGAGFDGESIRRCRAQARYAEARLMAV